MSPLKGGSAIGRLAPSGARRPELRELKGSAVGSEHLASGVGHAFLAHAYRAQTNPLIDKGGELRAYLMQTV
jgi:hypothetical protein